MKNGRSKTYESKTWFMDHELSNWTFVTGLLKLLRYILKIKIQPSLFDLCDLCFAINLFYVAFVKYGQYPMDPSW